MNIRHGLLLLVGIMLVLAGSASANVVASGLRISDASVATYSQATNTWDGSFADGSGVRVWFIVNESGKGVLTAAVTIRQGGTVIKSITVPSPAMGVNSVVWDGSDNSLAPAPAGSYTFSVTVNDPVGHTTFDSLWVVGATYQGNDLDGAATYGYRGVGAIHDPASPAFGQIYVARGSSGINGLYEIRGDGVYLRKIAVAPAWPASTPAEVVPVGGKIASLAGYGFTGSGFARFFSPVSGDRTDSVSFKSVNARGLAIRIVGADTITYSGFTGTAMHPQVVKVTGTGGDTVRHIDLAPYLTAGQLGYIKALAFDDAGNGYVAYGDASTTRKKLAKFDAAGALVWNKDAMADFGIAGTDVRFQSLALHHGSNLTSSADDQLYALIYSNTLTSWGIYAINLDGSIAAPLMSPNGGSNAATSQFITVDAVGNVIWSNGSTQERIVAFSPANGPNTALTVSPAGTDIVVTTPRTEPATSVDGGLVPRQTTLGNSYPNPFNPTAVVPFSVAVEGPATLVVYDLTGREVARLFDGIALPGVEYRRTFDGAHLPSGTYLVRLQAEGRVMSKRLSLLK
jgi:hypothetical protein